MNLSQQIESDYQLYKNQATKDSFFEIRERAFEAFKNLGLPTTKHEEWKYTNLKKIAETKMGYNERKVCIFKTEETHQVQAEN
jgi:Fe-S cluster assembly protein SufD